MAIGEWNFEDTERILDSFKHVIDERKKGADRWPKMLFEYHPFTTDLPKLSEDVQGFLIFETDNQDHIINEIWHYAPFSVSKYIPIVEGARTMKLWLDRRR